MKEQTWEAVIKSKQKAFSLNIRETLAYRDLIFLFVRRTFVSMYKQTILGPAWAILQPFLTTVVYTLFFGNIAGLGAEGVPNFIFYLSGTIMWNLFAHSFTQCANTFIANQSILGKVYFPRIVMPISTTISQFISFGIQFVFMIGFLIYYCVIGAGVAPNIFVLMLPLVLIQTAMLGLGCGIIVSALTTKYRDLAMLISFGVSLWSYASPVAYDMFGMSALAPGGSFYALYMLNPVTPIINVFRYGFLGIGGIDWLYYGISWGTTIIILLAGMLMFNKIEKTFADTV